MKWAKAGPRASSVVLPVRGEEGEGHGLYSNGPSSRARKTSLPFPATSDKSRTKEKGEHGAKTICNIKSSEEGLFIRGRYARPTVTVGLAYLIDNNL